MFEQNPTKPQHVLVDENIHCPARTQGSKGAREQGSITAKVCTLKLHSRLQLLVYFKNFLLKREIMLEREDQCLQGPVQS